MIDKIKEWIATTDNKLFNKLVGSVPTILIYMAVMVLTVLLILILSLPGFIIALLAVAAILFVIYYINRNEPPTFRGA